MSDEDASILPSDTDEAIECGDENGDHVDNKSYYSILGVSVTATPAEIRQAFLQLSRRYHSDKHALSTEAVKEAMSQRFLQLSTAYSVLSDPRERVAYDLQGERGSAHFALVPHGAQSSQDVVDMIRALDRAAKLKQLARMMAAASQMEVKYSSVRLFQWLLRQKGEEEADLVNGEEEEGVSEEGEGESLALDHNAEEDKEEGPSDDNSVAAHIELDSSSAQVAEVMLNGKPTIILIPNQEIIRQQLPQRKVAPIKGGGNRQARTMKKKLIPFYLVMKTLIPSSIQLQHSFQHALSSACFVKISGKAKSTEPPSLITELHWASSDYRTTHKLSLMTSMQKLSMRIVKYTQLSPLWGLRTTLSIFDGIKVLSFFTIGLLRKLSEEAVLENALTLSLFGESKFVSSVTAPQFGGMVTLEPGRVSFVSLARLSEENTADSPLLLTSKSKKRQRQFKYWLALMPESGVSSIGWSFTFRQTRYYQLGVGFEVTIPYSLSPAAPPFFIVQSSSLPFAIQTLQLLYQRGDHSVTIPIAAFAAESIWRSVAWLCAPLILIRLGVLLYHPIAKTYAMRHYTREREKHVVEVDIARQKALLEQQAIEDSVAQSRLREERKSGLVILSATFGVLHKEYEVNDADSPGSPTINSCVERPPLLTYYTNTVIQWFYNKYVYHRTVRRQRQRDASFPPASDAAALDIPLSIDVTIALQNLVRDSALTLPSGSKVGMTGFCDPDPYTAERKLLKIVYTFRDRRHVAVFNDDDEVTIPQREHLQE